MGRYGSLHSLPQCLVSTENTPHPKNSQPLSTTTTNRRKTTTTASSPSCKDGSIDRKNSTPKRQQNNKSQCPTIHLRRMSPAVSLRLPAHIHESHCTFTLACYSLVRPLPLLLYRSGTNHPP